MLIRKYAHVIAAASVLAVLAGCATQKTPEVAATTATTQPAPTEAPSAPATGAQASAADAGASLSARPVPGPTLADSQSSADSALTSTVNEVANKLNVNVFYFGFDQDTLDQTDTDALKAHALYLSKHKAAQAVLGGHADERGTREYNLALAERRGKAVAAFLRANGAAGSQLEVVSYGEEKPAVEGSDEAAWAKNRRVEVSYTAGKP